MKERDETCLVGLVSSRFFIMCLFIWFYFADLTPLFGIPGSQTAFLIKSYQTAFIQMAVIKHLIRRPDDMSLAILILQPDTVHGLFSIRSAFAAVIRLINSNNFIMFHLYHLLMFLHNAYILYASTFELFLSSFI